MPKIKGYEVREVEFDDLYEFLTILEDLQIDFTNVSMEEGGEFRAGVELILSTIANFKSAKKRTNAFLGGLANMSGEEFGKLPMKVGLSILSYFINEAKEADFFALFSVLKAKK